MKIQLVENWRKLWKAWTMWCASIGIVGPELLQLAADHIEAIPVLDAGHKSIIRLVCLVAIVLLRPVKQVSMQDETK